jgi:hypothetical protein
MSINISHKERIFFSFFHLLNMTLWIMDIMWDWILYMIEIQWLYILTPIVLFEFYETFDNIYVSTIYQITYYI